LHVLITFLCVLHPQCFASSTGAVLGAVLDPLQHCTSGRSSHGAAGAVFSDTRRLACWQLLAACL